MYVCVDHMYGCIVCNQPHVRTAQQIDFNFLRLINSIAASAVSRV